MDFQIQGGILMKGPERNMTKEQVEIMDGFLELSDKIIPFIKLLKEDYEEDF